MEIRGDDFRQRRRWVVCCERAVGRKTRDWASLERWVHRDRATEPRCSAHGREWIRLQYAYGNRCASGAPQFLPL